MSDSAQLIYALLCLVLVGSALVARRPSLGQTWKMALAWMAIFALMRGLYLAAQQLGFIGRGPHHTSPATAIDKLT